MGGGGDSSYLGTKVCIKWKYVPISTLNTYFVRFHCFPFVIRNSKKDLFLPEIMADSEVTTPSIAMED